MSPLSNNGPSATWRIWCGRGRTSGRPNVQPSIRALPPGWEILIRYAGGSVAHQGGGTISEYDGILGFKCVATVVNAGGGQAILNIEGTFAARGL
jgi:hypothetical protein